MKRKERESREKKGGDGKEGMAQRSSFAALLASAPGSCVLGYISCIIK